MHTKVLYCIVGCVLNSIALQCLWLIAILYSIYALFLHTLQLLGDPPNPDQDHHNDLVSVFIEKVIDSDRPLAAPVSLYVIIHIESSNCNCFVMCCILGCASNHAAAIFCTACRSSIRICPWSNKQDTVRRIFHLQTDAILANQCVSMPQKARFKASASDCLCVALLAE